MSQTTQQQVNKYLGVFMPVGAVGGFISDVIQPLAPLSTYVFWISLLTTVGIIIGALVARRARARVLSLLLDVFAKAGRPSGLPFGTRAAILGHRCEPYLPALARSP